ARHPGVFLSATFVWRTRGGCSGDALPHHPEEALSLRVNSSGLAGIYFRLLFQLQSRHLRKNCSEPAVPCGEESRTTFFDIALSSHRHIGLECGSHSGPEICAKRREETVKEPACKTSSIGWRGAGCSVCTRSPIQAVDKSFPQH